MAVVAAIRNSPSPQRQNLPTSWFESRCDIISSFETQEQDRVVVVGYVFFLSFFPMMMTSKISVTDPFDRESSSF
jgi:hypothetical protein